MTTLSEAYLINASPCDVTPVTHPISGHYVITDDVGHATDMRSCSIKSIHYSSSKRMVSRQIFTVLYVVPPSNSAIFS